MCESAGTDSRTVRNPSTPIELNQFDRSASGEVQFPYGRTDVPCVACMRRLLPVILFGCYPVSCDSLDGRYWFRAWGASPLLPPTCPSDAVSLFRLVWRRDCGLPPGTLPRTTCKFYRSIPLMGVSGGRGIKKNDTESSTSSVSSSLSRLDLVLRTRGIGPVLSS